MFKVKNNSRPTKAGRPTTFVVALVSSQHEALEKLLEEQIKDKAVLERAKTLLAQGGAYMSYDMHPRNDEGVPEPESVLKTLETGDLWLGEPGTEDAKVLVALRGGSNNSVYEDRVGRGGRSYRAMVGVKPSSWAQNQAQAGYDDYLAASGLKVRSGRRDTIPLGAAKAAPEAGGANEATPFD